MLYPQQPAAEAELLWGWAQIENCNQDTLLAGLNHEKNNVTSIRPMFKRPLSRQFWAKTISWMVHSVTPGKALLIGRRVDDGADKDVQLREDAGDARDPQDPHQLQDAQTCSEEGAVGRLAGPVGDDFNGQLKEKARGSKVLKAFVVWEEVILYVPPITEE